VSDIERHRGTEDGAGRAGPVQMKQIPLLSDGIRP
jgi:hypothetical protein